jgi:hypothetical protein
MRLMMTFTIPVEKGNETAENGSMARAIQAAIDALKPEAAYFTLVDGLRAGMLFFEGSDPAAMMRVHEHLFKSLNAAVSTKPALTIDELDRGFAAARSHA